MHDVDLRVIIPVLAGALIMLRWTYAYLKFPRALEAVMRRVDVGPFEPHLIGTGRFVRWCAHSHWLMALRDLMMLGIMSLVSAELYVAAIITFVVTLIPLWAGAQFSVKVARMLERDAHAINQFIRAAQRLTSHVD